MNIFYIGHENIDYGGRSLELLKVLSNIGDVKGIVLGTAKPEFVSGLTMVDPSSSYASFIATAKKEYKKNASSIDLLFIDNRKAALIACLLGKRINKKIIIYDMRELRIPSEILSIKSKIGCIPEKRIVKNADLVICANKERAEFVKLNYKTKKVTFFENIRKLDFSCVDEDCYRTKYINIFEKKSFKIISTSGTSISRGNDKLTEAVTKIKNHDIDLILCGGEFDEKGSDETIRRIISQNQAKNIHIIDKVKSKELFYLINHCDCGVVNYHSKDTNNKYCASGKLYEFIFAKKPVITTSNPPLKRIVEQYNIGSSGEDYLATIKNVIDNYNLYKTNVEQLANNLSVDENNKNLEREIKDIISNKLYLNI